MSSVLASSQIRDTVLTVAGSQLVPEPSGALWWPEQGTLAVADLHLEKGSAFAGRGQLLPPTTRPRRSSGWPKRSGAGGPRRLVCLGDSFHDRDAAERLAPEACSLIRASSGSAARSRWTGPPSKAPRRHRRAA